MKIFDHLFARQLAKPGGLAAFYFSSPETLKTMSFTQTGVFKYYTPQQVVNLLKRAGFKKAYYHEQNFGPGVGLGTGICAIGEK